MKNLIQKTILLLSIFCAFTVTDVNAQNKYGITCKTGDFIYANFEHKCSIIGPKSSKDIEVVCDEKDVIIVTDNLNFTIRKTNPNKPTIKVTVKLKGKDITSREFTILKAPEPIFRIERIDNKKYSYHERMQSKLSISKDTSDEFKLVANYPKYFQEIFPEQSKLTLLKCEVYQTKSGSSRPVAKKILIKSGANNFVPAKMFANLKSGDKLVVATEKLSRKLLDGKTVHINGNYIAKMKVVD